MPTEPSTSAPSTKHRSQAERAASRSNVTLRLQAAVERLLEEGGTYAEIGVDALVGEAGLAKSTFYVYFEDKQELLRVLANDLIASLIGFGEAWWTLPPDAGKDDLRAALGEMADAYRPHERLMAAVTEAAIYDSRMKAEFAALVRRAIAAIADHIGSGQAQGYVRPEVDPDRTALWLTWMLERGFYLLLRSSKPRQAERRLAALTDIVWSALYEGAR